ncbi:MAG: hypothetical protein U9R68_01510 [Planctomycetota bacterium]|nr:hypothetical protein [Planctomycetota bacterium]
MSTRTIPAVAAVLLLAACAATPGARADDADEARDTFNSLFAKDLETVQETGTKTDDVALAVRLVETAGKSTGSSAFLSILCEHACRLASGHPSGYATAIRAMELVAEHVPEKRAEARGRLLELRRKQFGAARGDERKAAGEALLDALLTLVEEKQAAGDLTRTAALYREARSVAKAASSDRLPHIEGAAEALARRIHLRQRVGDVQAILQKHPDNVGAREGLVRLYLVNLDDPKKAAGVLEGVEDSGLKKYVPAAARTVDEAPELACLELGEWYRGLAETAPDYAEAKMYGRAKAYLERFLSLHETKDLKRTRGKVAMEKVEEALAALTAPPPKPTPRKKPPKPQPGTMPPGRWISLLPLVSPNRDCHEGTCEHKADGLWVFSKANGRLTVPVLANGSYEAEFAWKRTWGPGQVTFTLPVGSGDVTLVLGAYAGAFSGLEKITGKGADKNETTVRPGKFESNQLYRVTIQVKLVGTQAHIEVRVDGKPYLSWTGPQSALSANYKVSRQGCFGLGLWGAGVLFSEGRLKMLSGEARLLRPGAAAAGTSEPVTVPAGSTIRPGQWVDVLPLVDPEKDTVKGGWKKRDGRLFIEQTPPWACIKVPVVTDGSYEIDVRFVRTSGDESLGVFLPVGSSRVLLEFSVLKGKAGGFNLIAGKPAPDNEAAVKPCVLENGREYSVHVRTLVRGETARIAVTLDGKPWTSWRGPHSSLSILHDWGMPHPKTFGFSAWCVGVSFRSARLKMLSGQARLLRAGG